MTQYLFTAPIKLIPQLTTIFYTGRSNGISEMGLWPTPKDASRMLISLQSPKMDSLIKLMEQFGITQILNVLVAQASWTQIAHQLVQGGTTISTSHTFL